MKHVLIGLDGTTHIWETPDEHAPLSNVGTLATLLAVLGIATIEDAANAVNLKPDDLVAEAQAWAAFTD